MDLKNISVGDKFSTYNKLVKVLGLQPAKGTQRKAQQKEIECHLSFQKTGKLNRGKETNEIIITEIYNMPHEKIDGRKNNIKRIEQYLMFSIGNEDIIKSKIALYYEFGCFNDKNFIEQYDDFACDNITKKQISIIKNIIFDVCRQTVYNRLISLSNKGYIYMEDAYKCEKGLFIKGSYEYNQIKDSENEAIKSCGFSTFSEAINSKSKKKFLRLRAFNIRRIRNQDGSRAYLNKCSHVIIIKKNKDYDMQDFDYDSTRIWFVNLIRKKYTERIKSYANTHNEKINNSFDTDKEKQIKNAVKKIPDLDYLCTEKDIIDYIIGEDEERKEYIKNCYYTGFGYINKNHLESIINLINEITGGNTDDRN